MVDEHQVEGRTQRGDGLLGLGVAHLDPIGEAGQLHHRARDLRVSFRGLERDEPPVPPAQEARDANRGVAAEGADLEGACGPLGAHLGVEDLALAIADVHQERVLAAEAVERGQHRLGVAGASVRARVGERLLDARRGAAQPVAREAPCLAQAEAQERDHVLCVHAEGHAHVVYLAPSPSGAFRRFCSSAPSRAIASLSSRVFAPVAPRWLEAAENSMIGKSSVLRGARLDHSRSTSAPQTRLISPTPGALAADGGRPRSRRTRAADGPAAFVEPELGVLEYGAEAGRDAASLRERELVRLDPLHEHAALAQPLADVLEVLHRVEVARPRVPRYEEVAHDRVEATVVPNRWLRPSASRTSTRGSSSTPPFSSRKSRPA